MAQIVGPESLMYQLNFVFENQIGTAMLDINLYDGYTGQLADREKVAVDQWGARLMTGNADIPIFVQEDTPILKVDSIYDLYNQDPSSYVMPNSFNLVPFPAELDYHMKTDFNFHQWRMLFADTSEGNVQTLMNPVNLHNFFEHYKNGDFDAIRKHFSYDYGKHPMTDDEIKGIMTYIHDVTVKYYAEDEKSTPQPDQSEYQAFGSLWSIMMKKSYTQLYNIMYKTLPTRYFAAYNNDNASNTGNSKCSDFLNGIVTNTTRAAAFCSKQRSMC